MSTRSRSTDSAPTATPARGPSLVLLMDDDIDYQSNRYEILYKQAVTAEDMFMGLSGRDPSSGSCEDLVVCRPARPLTHSLATGPHHSARRHGQAD